MLQKIFEKTYVCGNGFEQHIMSYLSACVYAAGIRKANEENCTVRNTEIHPLFIENAKFLLADLYITCDNLFLYQKKI